MNAPKLSVRQVTNMLTDAAERCSWKNIGFERTPKSIDIRFSDNYMDEPANIGTHSFSYNTWWYNEYDGNDLKQISEDEWLEKVDRYLWTLCGVHLDKTKAEW